jgi:hypothetical protein
VVEHSEEYGFLPALREATRDIEPGAILTFADYGTAWYTQGRFKAIDLFDSVHLGAYKESLTTRDARKMLSELSKSSVRVAVLPYGGSQFAHTYEDLRLNALPGLWSLADPLLVNSTAVEGWEIARPFPLSSVHAADAAVQLDLLDGSIISSPGQWSASFPLDKIRVRVSTKLRNPTLTLLGVTSDGAGGRGSFIDITLQGKERAGSYEYSVRNLFRNWPAPDPSVTINAFVLSSGANASLTLSSLGLIGRIDNGTFVPERLSSEFIADPLRSAISAVLLFDDRGGRAVLYPGEIRQEKQAGGRDSQFFRVLLRTANSCAGSSPMNVTVSAGLAGSLVHKSMTYSANQRGAVDIPIVNLERRLAAPSRQEHTIQIYSVSARACGAVTSIAFPQLAFYPSPVGYELAPGTQQPVVSIK